MLEKTRLSAFIKAAKNNHLENNFWSACLGVPNNVSIEIGRGLKGRCQCAGVVELVDARDSKSRSARSVGSIPTARTIDIVRHLYCGYCRCHTTAYSRWAAPRVHPLCPTYRDGGGVGQIWLAGFAARADEPGGIGRFA